MVVDYFPPFATWCYSVIVVDGCLSTVGNNGSKCSVGKNTILSETGHMSATESSNVPMLDSESSTDKSMTWSDFVVSINNHRSIEYERMSSEDGTAEDSVRVSESMIPVELENRKV